MEYQKLPLEEWNESNVRCWLESIQIKKQYVEKLFEEEVTGPALKEIDENFLRKIGMKEGQIQLLIKKRNEIAQLNFQSSENCKTAASAEDVATSDLMGAGAETEIQEIKALTRGKQRPQEDGPKQEVNSQINAAPNKEIMSQAEKSKHQGNEKSVLTVDSVNKCLSKPHPYSKRNRDEVSTVSKFRPFAIEDNNFKYVKNTVLPPETGLKDLIIPCHEYKSFITASALDRTRLQAKFAYEVIRFASACMNVRTNGTIHFGVVDSVENKEWEHGQIVGIKVKDRSVYVDALDYIETCFASSECELARHCIRPPQFIEVIEKDTEDKNFIVEIDIIPLYSNVNGKHFEVTLPKFNERSNKVYREKQAIYRRVGTKSESVTNEEYRAFIDEMASRDAKRKEAESRNTAITKTTEDLGRKLSVLLTNGRKSFDESLWYILVTNGCGREELQHSNFLMRMNIFCAFDFDANSECSGLCSKYKEHHATNLHSLKSYSKDQTMSTSDWIKQLHLFDQTSWIFCNGRTGYLGSDDPCDEDTWIRTKKKSLKKAVSIICDEILPKDSFIVIFLLLSPVEKPIMDTFNEFYEEMNGMENIICIAESQENYEKWANRAQLSCPNREKLDQISIVGMKLSHVDGTVQDMLPFTDYASHIPVSTKGQCVFRTLEKERMFSLEILCVDECNDIKLDLINKEQIEEIESTFYRGGKVSWKNFWLAEKKRCGEVIEREACEEVRQILNEILHRNTCKLPVARIKIVHQPGSGGSTVARQVLWKTRKELRCAVVKLSCPVSTVCDHAIKFREYEEKDFSQCLSVLLLVEDCDEEYLDDLKHELATVITAKNITCSKPCFILMSCNRSNTPEKLCKASPLDTIAVTHKLKDAEKVLFESKAKELEQQFPPEFIITFVLMSKEFNEQYVRDVVHNVLQGIDRSSRVTSLMKYVALLNFYVQNSYISLSHCEAFLGLGAYTDNEKNILRQSNFKNCLTEQARFMFIELRENTTWISSVSIIHPLVAKEILHQLSENQLHSKIAMDLLQETVLFQHRFGRDEFIRFTRDLFLRRFKKSKGDNVDSLFSPLVEHICEVEKHCDKAVELLRKAYECFGKDAFFAQLLARLLCKYEKFEDATIWAEKAKSHLPRDSFILDTEGQVYKKWFNVQVDNKGNVDLKPSEIIELIEMALKAMECFRAAQSAAKAEPDNINNSGFFGEVDVGCRLLQLLSSLEIFHKNEENVNSELVSYLITDYIPADIKKPWSKLHGRLKGLHKNIYNALDWISEDLSYFQTDKSEDEEQKSKVEEKVCNPRKWLVRKTEVFAKFFSSKFLSGETNEGSRDQSSMTQLMKSMNIYKHGGGNPTTILSLLSDLKDERSARKLETIINLYPKDRTNLEVSSRINYILCHISLGCVSPSSPNLLSFQELRELSKSFFQKRKLFPASAYFLLILLYWPDNAEDKRSDPDKDDILKVALDSLKQKHDEKIKNVPVRKKRIYTQFFLGNGYGLRKIIHRSRIDKLSEGSLNEWRLKWLNGEVWKTHCIQQALKRIDGWTEDGKVFVRGHGQKRGMLQRKSPSTGWRQPVLITATEKRFLGRKGSYRPVYRKLCVTDSRIHRLTCHDREKTFLGSH
uniref:Sterile alpha motif domain-containing protein 9-like isoform X2 n=1 Tax=Geotrypetes seraphini TaxID=260995 RepID=A0A6P8SJJ1_GEOSA|nr:sterile alpha motif domain-containing protein 9-like isoform X2 [Geotrypetes seraphini]XP_033816599.1 sterile alpha motif domain-containing protein 9-like isoform X2 [Geotrypetes seraphini]